MDTAFFGALVALLVFLYWRRVRFALRRMGGIPCTFANPNVWAKTATEREPETLDFAFTKTNEVLCVRRAQIVSSTSWVSKPLMAPSWDSPRVVEIALRDGRRLFVAEPHEPLEQVLHRWQVVATEIEL